ncbi:fluoride efflux transporter FluC [Salirhabdus salicampi]|uniref:fluoride efflux transporter FluC n=1 Tax=Salirhabdus salicampi TaxID=476102 RepID=UPI0020C52875|nr:CrcB family protein [Salirhabdus salicampi]MCP8617713.1 CrcB family protein [Salirhabdus salicampi]
MTLKSWMLIALGGGFGALSRYSLSVVLLHEGVFPIATLLVNFIGCALLPFVFFHRQREMTLLVGTGFFGSFTTFSTFSLESMNLLMEKQYMLFSLYTSLTIIGGVVLSAISFTIIMKKGGKRK